MIGCAQEKSVSVTFEVDGMDVRNGFLWLGWPANVGKALDGLKGVSEHAFDNDTWVYSVTYDQGKLSREKIIQVVEAAEEGFKVKNWKQLEPKQGN